MNHVIVKHLAVVACILVLLIALPGAVLAQEEVDDAIPDVQIEGDPAMYPDVIDPGSEGEVEDAGADFVLAQPPYTMNYQGYLTDSAGTAVDGTYDFVARLYDAESAGTQEWGPENHDDVPVANGLFNLVLGSTTPLVPNDFDKALFLQLTVQGTDLPRQPLRTTAYAFALVPGAEVQGEPSGTDYALTAYNTSADANASGLYARGKKWGVYARGDEYGLYAVGGTGDVGIYSPDFIRGKGFRSDSDSYMFVPGQVAVPEDGYDSALVTVDLSTGGDVVVKKLGILLPSVRSVYLPIQVPSVLYGQNVTIEQIRLYYSLSDPNNTYVTGVTLQRSDVTSGNLVTMLNSLTDRKGTGFSYADYTPTDGELSPTTGPVSLRILMNFQDNSDTVRIYGVRLRLGHY